MHKSQGLAHNFARSKKTQIKDCQQGFGDEGLGIVTISGVPGFAELRARLLPMAAQLAVGCPFTELCSDHQAALLAS